MLILIQGTVRIGLNKQEKGKKRGTKLRGGEKEQKINLKTFVGKIIVYMRRGKGCKEWDGCNFSNLED